MSNLSEQSASSKRAWLKTTALSLGFWSWSGLFALPAWARAAPAELTTLAPGLQLRGAFHFTFFAFEVYDISLWVAADFKPEALDQQVFALELRYLRDFAAKDIAQRSIKEMRRSASISAAQEQQWLAEMQRVFPNIRKGDRLLGLYRPGQAAVFWHNEVPRGEVADLDFARLFFGIWLSPKTSEPTMRQRLLGQGS